MTYADQAHFNNYDATTYGWPQGIPPLVPFSFDGVNFGQCARDAHGAFMALLTELVPHIPGGLRAGKCWGFSTTDDLSDGSWSMHHRGLAADVNWDKNPMGTYATNPYAGQAGAIPHAIASQIATKYGFEYGGDWSGGEGVRGFKDYMHFELHLPPTVARTVTTSIEEFTMDAAATKAFDDLNGRISTIERMISSAYAQDKANFNQMIAKFGLTFRGDPTHPDSLKALHDELGKLIAALPKDGA